LVKEPMMGPHPSLRILCYHSIADLEATSIADYATPPGLFEAQIKAVLKLRYSFIDPRDFDPLVAGKMRPKPRSVLLTFDDCYQDLVDAAFPILEHYGIKAMAFCVTGHMGGHNDWDRGKAPALPLAGVDQLKRLEGAGWVIGAHTRNHPDLTTLPAAQVVEEIGGSIADLKAAGLEAPRFLAYPYGFSNDQVVQACRELGLSGAFTVEVGKFEPGKDPFRIPRIEVLRSHKRLKFIANFLRAEA
jgi:peptidoglycan/xylan/chitin deacetylase (PgdA/CDA1 family)